MEANKKVLFSHFWVLQSCGFSLFFLLIQVNYAFIIQITYVTSTINLGPSRMEKAIGKSFYYLPFFVLSSFFLNWVPVIPSYFISWGFPGGSVVKNLPVSAGDKGSIPRLGRSPGEGSGYPLEYSCLENPMDRDAWKARAHWFTELDVT